MTLEQQIYHFMRGFGLKKTEAKWVAKGLAEMLTPAEEEKKT